MTAAFYEPWRWFLECRWLCYITINYFHCIIIFLNHHCCLFVLRSERLVWFLLLWIRDIGVFTAIFFLKWRLRQMVLHRTVRPIERYCPWIRYHSSWTKWFKTRQYGSEKIFSPICWQLKTWGGLTLNRRLATQTPSWKAEKACEKLMILIGKSKILKE